MKKYDGERMGYSRFIIAASVLFTLPAAAKKPADTLAEYETTGEIVECLPRGRVRYDAIDGTKFLFRVGADNLYLNETIGECQRADSKSKVVVIYKSSSLYCSGDSVMVTDRGSGGVVSACRLGPFQALQKKTNEED